MEFRLLKRSMKNVYLLRRTSDYDFGEAQTEQTDESLQNCTNQNTYKKSALSTHILEFL